MAALDEDELRAVAALPALRDRAVLDGLVRGVVATGLWAEFLPMVAALPPTARRIVAKAAGALSDPDLDALAVGVEKEDLWELVFPLVELMGDGARRRLFELPAFRERAAG